ncbi:MAG: hypothetical protein ACKV2U_26720 [Bryobacteraceae bacterium]
MINYWVLASRRLLLLGLLPLLAGTIVGWRGWALKRNAAAFVENLRQAEGRVLQIAPGPDGALVDVEYLNEAGERFKKRFRVDGRHEAELRAVGKISMVYDVRDPRVAELGHVVSANAEMTLYLGMTAAGVLLGLGGLLVIGKHAKLVTGTASLFRNGQLVQTEVRDSTLAPGGKTGRFTYAFRGPNGRWNDGKSPEMSAARLAEWPVGRPLVAAYDATDPRRSEPDIFGVVERGRRNAVQPA